MTENIDIDTLRLGGLHYIYFDGEAEVALSFTECARQINFLAHELGDYDDPSDNLPLGSLAAFQTWRGMRLAMQTHFERTGEASMSELTLQLLGRDGEFVVVEDEDGDQQRLFTVGSRGEAFPYHVEITDSGEKRARIEYASVETVEEVQHGSG